MNWLGIGKGLVTFVASASVGTVITNVVKATMPKDVTTANKVMTIIGGFVLSSMAGTVTTAYVARELDGLFPAKIKVEEPAKTA